MRGASRVAFADARDRLTEVVADADVAATVGDELFAVVRLLDQLLSGKVAVASLRLITQAVINPRGRNLEANLADYARLVADWRQRLIAVVRVATELSARQRQRLTRALSAIYGHGIQLNVIIDPRVVGGMSIQIGDELIDGTLSSRLAELRRHWAA